MLSRNATSYALVLFIGFVAAVFGSFAQAADSTAPSAPTNLSVTAISTTQLNLSWTASTDNVGVTGYKIERCQGSSCTNYAQISTSTTASFNNTGLTASTTYRYRVRANDAASNNSSYSAVVNQATLTPDTTAPTAPTGLTATAISTTQINLSWTASTDTVGVTGYKIERCQGSSCTNYAQISTSTTTSFNNTGLTASTTYRYRVRANDAASNNSSYSAVVNQATLTPDTTAPTAPTGLTATAISTTQINLSWTASTDTVGVTGYKIERCQGSTCTTYAQVATSATTSFSDSGLTASTTYRYRVRANDAAGNNSSYSAVVNQATLTPDTTAPTAPTGLTATAISTTQINLSWTASTDTVGVTGYKIERCQGSTCTTYAQVATSATTSFSDSGLTASTTYRYRVRANDAAGNNSSYSAVVNQATLTPDTTAPTAPTGLTATAISTTQINLSWTASTDTVGVTGYKIERCQGSTCTTYAQVATSATTSFSDSGLTASTTYRYRVRANDAAGNNSSYSAVVNQATSTPPDTQAPTAPAGVVASPVSSTQINLSWNASTDNVGVTGYLVERCQSAGCTDFLEIATPVGATHINMGLTGATSYSYRVRARDAANNVSLYSSIATVSTLVAPDVQAPTAPAGISAAAISSSQIGISWTAATDNVGVETYQIERCSGIACSAFTLVQTVTTTTYGDTGLAGSTTYRYRVRATDAAVNYGAYSNAVSATTWPPLGSASYQYDATGKLNAITQGNGSVTQYTYDAVGNVVSISVTP